jgi:hypothetical protein
VSLTPHSKKATPMGHDIGPEASRCAPARSTSRHDSRELPPLGIKTGVPGMHACSARPGKDRQPARRNSRDGAEPAPAWSRPARSSRSQWIGFCGSMMSAACRSARAIRSRGLTFRSSSASSGSSSRDGVRSSTPGSPPALATRPALAALAVRRAWSAMRPTTMSVRRVPSARLTSCPASAEVPCHSGECPVVVPGRRRAGQVAPPQARLLLLRPPEPVTGLRSRSGSGRPAACIPLRCTGRLR